MWFRKNLSTDSEMPCAMVSFHPCILHWRLHHSQPSVAWLLANDQNSTTRVMQSHHRCFWNRGRRRSEWVSLQFPSDPYPWNRILAKASTHWSSLYSRQRHAQPVTLQRLCDLHSMPDAVVKVLLIWDWCWHLHSTILVHVMYFHFPQLDEKVHHCLHYRFPILWLYCHSA